MDLKSFDVLVEKAKSLKGKSAVAVAAAADKHVIEATLEAKNNGIAEPVLIGDENAIKEILREMDLNPSDWQIQPTMAGLNDAETAVELIKSGGASALMKGMLETTDLLRPVVKKENGLRTGRQMSHVTLFELPGYHKLLGLTDAGMTPYPDLAKKKDILVNAFEVFHKIGYEMPKAACLCCKETVDEKMPETTDARVLREMCEMGEMGKAFVEGPISYDVAMSAEIAKAKKFDRPHCGDFDLLLTHDIHAGNVLAKCLIVTAGATMSGLIMGAKMPIILSSRGSSSLEKYMSLVLASVIAQG